MRVLCLGTGSPEPSVQRASSGYLVETGGDLLMLDCGGGVFGRLLECGRHPVDIEWLFISHLHSDHMMDYARLVHAAWDCGARPLRVFGPAPIGQITTGLFGPEGVFAHDLRARCEAEPSKEVWTRRGGTLPRLWPSPQVTEIEPGFTVEGDGWTLSTCEVQHVQPFLQCLAFRIDSNGRSVVYASDAGPSGTLESFARGADLLIHWCYRMAGEADGTEMARLSPTARDIAELANRAAVGKLVLTHIKPSMDTEENIGMIIRELESVCKGAFAIASDLTVYQV